MTNIPSGWWPAVSPDVCSAAQVSTADSPTRGPGTGSWEIASAEGKATGTPVVSGDR